MRLRRSIGLKKDEFFLDRKHMTKPEVMNLLESAGFSRSNPYYVVQQGKIQALTVMRDTERLELLKDIGGTKVYDERRKESFKILHETASRQAQIEETIDYIDQRLAEYVADIKARLSLRQSTKASLDRALRGAFEVEPGDTEADVLNAVTRAAHEPERFGALLTQIEQWELESYAGGRMAELVAR